MPLSSLLHMVYRGDIVNPCDTTVFITALANALACNLTSDELALLSSMLVQLGDTMVTIAAQKSICAK